MAVIITTLNPNTQDAIATAADANHALRLLFAKTYDYLRNWNDFDHFKAVCDRQGNNDEALEDFFPC